MIANGTILPDVNGSGMVARVKFKSLASTPSGTQVLFSLTNVSATAPSGNPITLAPGSATVTIVGVVVWPGDTDNDGVVDQADILPIGLCWMQTGPARQNASTNWVGQLATPWTLVSCIYADANGDGVVNQADVLPIGLNFGKTHSTAGLAVGKNNPPCSQQV